MKFSDNLAKVLFVLSLVLLVFLYGFWAGYKGAPPKGFLDKALEQARKFRNVLGFLPFTHRNPNTQPRVYKQKGVNIVKPKKIYPGLTLITTLWDWDNDDKLEGGVKLIDQQGDTIHQWQIDRQKFVTKTDLSGIAARSKVIHGTYLFRKNGNLLLNLEGAGTALFDACGKVLWRLPEFTSHSIARSEDGTFYIPGAYQGASSNSKNYPNGFPGFGGRAVSVQRIVHVSKDGKLLNSINIPNLLYKNNLMRYVVKATRAGSDLEGVIPGITHINDVEPLNSSMADEYPLFEAGDLLVSLRTPSLVFVFDPETLEVKWHASEPFNHQHDPDFIGNGRIGVFDNNTDPTDRGAMLGGSRIVSIQPHKKEKNILFPTKNSEPFYTSIRGKWQKLENGNMLLTEAQTGRVVEVTPNGNTVWEWVHKPISDSEVAAVTKATRYDLTKEDVATWPCSSVSTSENTEQEGG